MGGLLAAWLAEVTLISYRAVKQGSPGPLSPLPMPSTYVASVLVYGALGLVATSPRAAPVAAVAGWGLVAATALNLWNPSTGGVNGAKAATSTQPGPTGPGAAAAPSTGGK